MVTTHIDSKKALTVNPEVFGNIKQYGAFDVSACYSCGQCTVTCPLSVSGTEFPRKMIRWAVLGLEDKILSAPEPWLCYYCGDCSTTCPSQADPGGFMMALRRHAIVKYSVGKIANLFYTPRTAIFTYLVLALFGILALAFFAMDSHINLSEFDSYSLIHEEAIHIVGSLLAVIIFAIAGLNAFNMLRSLNKNSQTPADLPMSKKLSALLKSLFKTGIFEGIFEKRYSDCDSKVRYLAHMAIFWGFVFMGTATTVVFVVDFLIFYDLLGPNTATILDRELWKFLGKILGVLGGILLIFGTGYHIYKRIVKNDDYSKTSHFSDWIFLLLAFFLGLGGFMMDVIIFFIPSLMSFAYLLYAAHIILAFILVITATFTKFAHMEYRLLSVWFTEYQNIVTQSSIS
ncbi:MAG: 4Fe-4S dicluster domain-containing protein [Candidatus Hodarchaeales archaeon]|jgi:ferredoxin/nitrate reductase gamma subunit